MSEDRSRQRLGRGLASLIGAGAAEPRRAVPGFPDAVRAAPAEPAIPAERTVPIARITPNPFNPRKTFDDAELAELSASIRIHGVVQPLLVRPRAGEAGAYELVAGERRLRAAKLAGLSEVPVVLREIGDRQSLEIAIIENVQRSDLNAIEEALAYEMLIDEHGYTQADLAEVLGKSRSHVANTLRLLKLPDEVRHMVSSGALTPGAARTVVTAEDPLAAAQAIVSGGLSVREAEDRARGGAAKPEKAPRKAGKSASRTAVDVSEKDEDTRALERLLSETLGMPVEISFNGDGGSLRIDYRDLEQLDEICGLLQQARQNRRAAAEPRIRSL